jgi:hypothetical protein
MFLRKVGLVLVLSMSGGRWRVGVGVSKAEGIHESSMYWAVPCVVWCYALSLCTSCREIRASIVGIPSADLSYNPNTDENELVLKLTSSALV